MSELRDRLVGRMKRYFGANEDLIRHALNVTQTAEHILSYEVDAERDTVIAAAVLHDIGIPEAVRKHGSPAALYQELEGPPIAREIMLREGLPEKLIEDVCQIIAHHHTPGVVTTKNYEVIYDADSIVNSAARGESVGEFLTEGGRKVSDGPTAWHESALES